MNTKIYFDNAATTKVDPLVIESMLEMFEQNYGNASSLHSFGNNAKNALDKSREDIAKLMGADSNELIFTSGGTESNNLAIKGIALANQHKGKHIIVSSIEHDCILNACKWLETQGFFITYLPVDEYGSVNPDDVAKYISPKTTLVSVMFANNEIGTIQPIEAIGKICKAKNILFHTDACQAFGKMKIDVNSLNIDLMTINAHKIYGPKGIGALYIRKGALIEPQLHGGGQEFGLRSTTENLPCIVGFAKAATLCHEQMETEHNRVFGLRNKLETALLETIEGSYINGHPTNRIAGNINLGISQLEGETIRLLFLMDEQGFAVSAGSACSSNDTSNNASHVLKAIGRDQFQSRGAVRISVGRYNTEAEINQFVDALAKVTKQLNPIFSL
ncbi:MAG: cysteine desulfurase family protein [Bacteroidota bacterium]